jgi:hypothetical protein
MYILEATTIRDFLFSFPLQSSPRLWSDTRASFPSLIATITLMKMSAADLPQIHRFEVVLASDTGSDQSSSASQDPNSWGATVGLNTFFTACRLTVHAVLVKRDKSNPTIHGWYCHLRAPSADTALAMPAFNDYGNNHMTCSHCGQVDCQPLSFVIAHPCAHSER